MTSLAVFLSGATLVTSRPVIENHPYTSSGSTMKASRRRRLPLEHSAARLLGFLFTGFGFVILGGGPGRFPPPTYQPLLDLTGGSVWPYALLYLASGLLLFGRTIVTRMTGAGLGILANSAFAALFLVAVLTFPTAGSTAWWAYAGFASQSAVLAGLLWTEHTSSRREPGRHGDE